MFIKPCPYCGRMPKIMECVSWRPGSRRRMVACPNLCSVIRNEDHKYRWWPNTATIWFVEGYDCDDNTLFKKWNEMLITKA